MSSSWVPLGNDFVARFGIFCFGGLPSSGVNVLLILAVSLYIPHKMAVGQRIFKSKIFKDGPNVDGLILAKMNFYTLKYLLFEMLLAAPPNCILFLKNPECLL